MANTDGIFMLEAQQPVDVEGTPTSRANWMLVFTIDPFDIAGTDRYLPSPAHTDGDDLLEALIPDNTLILLADTAPHIVPALNNGTAYFTIVGISHVSPINIVTARAQAAVIWQAFSDGGISNIATDRFEFAGDYTELTP